MPLSPGVAVALIAAALVFAGAEKVGHGAKVFGREAKHVVTRGIFHRHPKNEPPVQTSSAR